MIRKKRMIRELKDGELISDIFVVKIKRGMFPYKNGHYFHLILTDASGETMNYKYWGGQDEEKVRGIYESIKADDVVLVTGKVQSYRGNLEISADESSEIRVLKEGEYDVNDFIEKEHRDIGEMLAELDRKIESIKSNELKTLLKAFFVDDLQFRKKFSEHPGAIMIHHNWRGGLLQHTLEVADYCELASKHYRDLDRDLLIAGALLHDIGKVKEIVTTTRIKGSRSGQLHGHITQGVIMLSEKMKELGLSEDLKDKLIHIMISHHGELEYGSIKAPMFPEALAVYLADLMSSQITEIVEFRRRSISKTEDDFMYSKRRSRNILLK
ncbi:hypothetical protein DRN74_02460 [Candidatus Micrarchaeota archaeon]|nr:MAG: hypothetical protein DRN74_02460 [Candidatus Micrarchaeota archaeon]